jgi:hypothetical protein
MHTSYAHADAGTLRRSADREREPSIRRPIFPNLEVEVV